MIDPVTSWSRMFAATTSMVGTSMLAAETVTASVGAIAARTTIIRAAMANPGQADFRELTRMVTEKIAAFTQVGEAITRGLAAWNKILLIEAHQLGTVASRGRAPTPGEWFALVERSAMFGIAFSEQSARVCARLSVKRYRPRRRKSFQARPHVICRSASSHPA